MDAEKDTMINQLETARAELSQALEKVSPQTEIYPSWKLKHLLDHITGWDVLVASAFRTHAQGGIPEKKRIHGINRFNAQSVTERQELTDEQSRQAFDEARAEIIRILRDMPVDRLDMEFPAPWGGSCTVPIVVKIFANHELEHARQIAALPG